jgi:hypothetical protein
MFELMIMTKSEDYGLRTRRNSSGVSVGTLKPGVSGILPSVMRTTLKPQMAHIEGNHQRITFYVGRYESHGAHAIAVSIE